MRLVYTVNKSVTAAGVTVQDQVFTGNGCFDPDITAAGSQPANFDDWSALYGRYRVYGSRITIYPLPQGAATGAGVWYIAVAARHTTTAVNSVSAFDNAVSQPMVDMISVGASQGAGGVGSQGFPLSPYTKYYTTAQVLGYTEGAIKDDDTLQALTSANPTHQWYWHVIVRVADDTTTGDGRFYCKVEYDVEFFDRLDTAIDLETKIYNDLVRLVSRTKREEKQQGTRELKTKGNLLSELLFEYKDQILDPSHSEGRISPEHTARGFGTGGFVKVIPPDGESPMSRDSVATSSRGDPPRDILPRVALTRQNRLP